VAVRRRAERQGAGGYEHAGVVVGSGFGGSVATDRLARRLEPAASLRRVLTTHGS
jgi:hypothetical protein